MKAFPIFLSVEDKTIIVFGGGADAAAKLRLVLKTCANVLVVAEHLDRDVLELGHATWVKSEPTNFALPENTAFAFAATGDQRLDRALADSCRAAGVIVCAVDQPSVSDFSTPAIVDRDPVIVAIGTEGTAPVLSRQIKASVESLLEPGLGLIATAANKLRPWAAKHIAPGRARRTFWNKLFEGARRQQTTSTSALIELAQDIEGEHSEPENGFVSFISASNSDPELLTLKARKALDQADVVLYDTETPGTVLELCRREATLILAPAYDRTALTLEQASSGQQVVSVRGSRHSSHLDELSLLLDRGIAAQVIPGVATASVTPITSPSPLIHKEAA